MKKQLNPGLMADLAQILAKYDPSELRDALAELATPSGLANLTSLVEYAIRAGVHPRTSRPQKQHNEARPTADERIARIKESRPADAALIDEVLAIAKAPWSKERTALLRELTQRYNERPITGKTVAERRSQLISRIERAPRALLEEIVDAFRVTAHASGTLQEWSDIILRDRKPKPGPA